MQDAGKAKHARGADSAAWHARFKNHSITKRQWQSDGHTPLQRYYRSWVTHRHMSLDLCHRYVYFSQDLHNTD